MTYQSGMLDLTSLAETVAELLQQRVQTVAVSESAAGGLLSAAQLAIPGASSDCVGGGVIYTRAARRALLGFGKKDANMRGASEDYVLTAATAIRELLGTTWGVAESGAAGPGGNSYGDDPGHACIAVVGPVERVMTVETDSDDREANMWEFAATALELLEDTVREYSGVITVYGIASCDTCRKALKWLAKQGIEHRFHDMREHGIDGVTLNEWINELGWDRLLNRRSASWRQLPEAMREHVSPVSAATLMLANPTLIKRPILDLGGQRLIGFGRDEIEALRDFG